MEVKQATWYHLHYRVDIFKHITGLTEESVQNHCFGRIVRREKTLFFIICMSDTKIMPRTQGKVMTIIVNQALLTLHLMVDIL